MVMTNVFLKKYGIKWIRMEFTYLTSHILFAIHSLHSR